jgi:hypothetical protein
MKVPNIDYAVDNFALGGGHATGSYEGPSPDILRLVNNVATQGSILNFAENAPCKDCAYSLSFYGPLVRCNQLAGNWSNLITTTVSNWTTTANYEEDVPLYSAFVPSIVEDSNFTAAFIDGLNALYKNDFLPIDANSTDYSKLFINYYSSNSHGLECGLYNASYEVDFNFNNGTQSVNLANLTYLNGVAYADYSTYQLLEGFNLTDYPQLPNNETVQAGLRYDMSVAAYQAVMQSLNSILVGHMEQSSADSGVLISNIRILSSCLSTSPELGDIVGAMTQFSADPNAPSISSSNVPLAQAIQELSQNITMSLFSSPDYL